MASYPTRCLNSLRSRDSFSQENAEVPPTEARVKLHIIIVGAGLGGISTAIALRRRGHSVTVFERTAKLEEVGAGIQVPPNSCRILLKFGLESYLKEHLFEPSVFTFRRWEDGNIVGLTRLVPDFSNTFDAPYYVIHRAHLQRALFLKALNLGVKVHLGSKVKSYEPEKPSLTLENGLRYEADLIVAADGMNSEARKVVLNGEDQPPQRTGFAAYRALVDIARIEADPELAPLLEIPGQNCWIGDDRHVMTYTIAGGKSLNMVLIHPDGKNSGEKKRETKLEEMRKHYEYWDPRITKIIGMIDDTLEWPLLTGRPLRNWVSKSGKLVVIGDAAHSMVPYMAQGAAMAVEDAAALAEVLSLITSRSQLHSALQVFERVRILRTGQMQEASLRAGSIIHFADGPKQRLRDEAMRPEVEGRHFIQSPNHYSDPVTQNWVYGYDAESEVRKAWDKQMRNGCKL